MQNRKSTGFVSSYAVDPQQWVAKYADYLYSYTFKRIKNEDLARDLVQETMLAALEGMANFEGRSSEITWLTSILKNKICDLLRKKSTGGLDMIGLSEINPFFNDYDGHWIEKHRPVEFKMDVDEPEHQEEFMDFFQKCLKKLPSAWSLVFTMKHLDEKTTEVICTELSITPANFWVIIHRAKLNLRACIQKNVNQELL